MRRLHQLFIQVFAQIPPWLRTGLIALTTCGLIIGCGGTTPSPSQTLAPTDCNPIQHQMGKTCVPLQPERVVVLDKAILANAIALGIQPVGSIMQPNFFTEKMPSYLTGKVDKDLASVGIESQPNLEKILELKPDLILGFNFGIAYDPLSQIAPTVIIEWQDAGHWQDHLLKAAEALGKTDEAEQLLAAYDARIAELKTALDQPPETIQVSLAYISGNTPFVRSDVKNSFAGSILADVGLGRPPAQDIVHEDYQIEVGPEQISTLDGDLLFLQSTNDENGEETSQRLKNHPLWQQLQVVQNDHVYQVDFDTWRMRNILAANGVIDDLFKYLVADNDES